MQARPSNGTARDIDGKPCVYYDGYWIRRYDPPENTLAAKRNLIEQLTRRVFHNTESGIATPGFRLDEARAAFVAESEPAKKRVKGAMLAGALLHRASEIFTKIVELQEAGVEIVSGNFLLRETGRCFIEALELGKTVKHFSGEEGLDELWGEPMKVFSMPVDKFYETRYVKIAQTMDEIDEITGRLIETFGSCRGFEAFADVALAFAEAAKLESETLRSDAVIFDVWPEFVTTGDRLSEFTPDIPESLDEHTAPLLDEGLALIRHGKDVISYLASARVPMPKSYQKYLAACAEYQRRLPASWFDKSRHRKAANQ